MTATRTAVRSASSQPLRLKPGSTHDASTSPTVRADDAQHGTAQVAPTQVPPGVCARGRSGHVATVAESEPRVMARCG